MDYGEGGIIVGGTYLLEGKGNPILCISHDFLPLSLSLSLSLSLCAHWPTILRTSARSRPRFYKLGGGGKLLRIAWTPYAFGKCLDTTIVLTTSPPSPTSPPPPLLLLISFFFFFFFFGFFFVCVVVFF